MVLCRINGTHPARRLRDEMDRIFEGFFESVPGGTPLATYSRRTFPAFNVWEEAEDLFVEAELPGMKMDEIEVLVIGDELTVKGERKDLQREDATYYRRERGAGTFSRVLRLSVEVDADKVEATLRDGVLTIKLPKAQAALPRKIEVVGE